jgi:hypothetical protein
MEYKQKDYVHKHYLIKSTILIFLGLIFVFLVHCFGLFLLSCSQLEKKVRKSYKSAYLFMWIQH